MTLKSVVLLSVPITLDAIHISVPRSSRSKVGIVKVLSTVTLLRVLLTVFNTDKFLEIGSPFNDLH